MLIEYSEENSGGNWWLSEENWRALEKNGWKKKYYKDGSFMQRATKEFASVEEAITEFERLTGLDADEQGCPCCGRPHNFSQEYPPKEE